MRKGCFISEPGTIACTPPSSLRVRAIALGHLCCGCGSSGLCSCQGTEDKETRPNNPKVKMRWEGHTFPGRLESSSCSDFQDVHTEEAVRLQQHTAHHRGLQEGATRRQQTMTLSSLQLHRPLSPLDATRCT